MDEKRLAAWLRTERFGQGAPPGRRLEAENRRLKAEVQALRRELEFMKRAAAFLKT